MQLKQGSKYKECRCSNGRQASGISSAQDRRLGFVWKICFWSVDFRRNNFWRRSWFWSVGFRYIWFARSSWLSYRIFRLLEGDGKSDMT